MSIKSTNNNDDIFYSGPSGYPVLEAQSDFKSLCGADFPTYPPLIIQTLIKLKTGELLGGEYVINKFLQAQPTLDHIYGVEDIINKRISKLLCDNTNLDNQSQNEFSILQNILTQVISFRHKNSQF